MKFYIKICISWCKFNLYEYSVNPCEDFYQYACGGFEERVRIPDDQSSRSQFAIIDDELEEQLRDILEANDTSDDSIGKCIFATAPLFIVLLFIVWNRVY